MPTCYMLYYRRLKSSGSWNFSNLKTDWSSQNREIVKYSLQKNYKHWETGVENMEITFIQMK